MEIRQVFEADDHSQHDEVVRRDPAREHGRRASIDPMRQRIGPVSPIKPAGGLSQHPLNREAFGY